MEKNELINIKPMEIPNIKLNYSDFIYGDKNLYSKIENLIIAWNIDATKTAGHLTRQIMELLKDNK